MAQVFPGPHESLLRIPAAAAFHYAMIAERQRWQRLEDARTAACFHRLDKRGMQSLLARISLMLSGPGEIERPERRWSEVERAEAEKANAERDAVYERLKAAGLLHDVSGAPPIQSKLRQVKRVK